MLHRAIEQAQAIEAGGGVERDLAQAHTDALVVLHRGGVACHIGGVVDDPGAGIDDGLDIGGAVGLRCGHGSAGQRLVKGSQPLAFRDARW